MQVMTKNLAYIFDHLKTTHTGRVPKIYPANQ